MKKQIAVIGLGRFGVSVATTLYGMGHDVLAVDDDEKSAAKVTAQITRVIQADSTNEAVLKDLGIGDFQVAIVGMGSAVENSVLTTILLKRLGVPYVIARAGSELHGSILEKIGADEVVYPEREMGIRTAHAVTVRESTDYMPVIHGYGVVKLPAQDCFVGERLSELGFGPKGQWEVAVLLIQRKNEVIVSPRPEETVKPGDVLIVAGQDDKVQGLVTEAKKNHRRG